MTARQLDFIRSLAQQKDTNLLSTEQQTYLARIVAGEVDPAPAAASRVIDALLALPDGAEAPAAAPAVEVDAGRYALVDEHGVVKFYSVDRPTEGRWAGRTFVNALASDERHPIRNRESRNAILAAIAADPARAMRLFAAELGRCAYCGRTLTDETSRAAGIGPDCAQQHGIDRSVWAEAAQREQADRVRSAYDDEAAPQEEGRPVVEPVELDGAAEDIRWSNEFAERERQQERAAYEAEMREEEQLGIGRHSVAPSSDNFVDQQRDLASARRRDPSSAMTWRQRRAAIAEQQGRETISRGGMTQITGELPGSTWEDIFGMGGR